MAKRDSFAGNWLRGNPVPLHAFHPGLLEEEACRLWAASRLTHDGIKTLGTPRRLVLLVYGLAEAAGPGEKKKGPAVRAAFDAAGNPTRAAEGFARSQGVPRLGPAPRGEVDGTEYVFAYKTMEGRQPGSYCRSCCLP
jgi:glycyl-tRNA synthetase beta chain